MLIFRKAERNTAALGLNIDICIFLFIINEPQNAGDKMISEISR